MNSGSRLDRLLKWRPTTGTDQAFAIYLYPLFPTPPPPVYHLPFTDVRRSALTAAGEGRTWTMWRFWGLAHPQFLCVFATLQFTVLPPPLSFLLVFCFLFFGFAGNAQILFLAQFAASGVKLYFALASAPEVRAPLPARCCCCCGTSA